MFSTYQHTSSAKINQRKSDVEGSKTPDEPGYAAECIPDHLLDVF